MGSQVDVRILRYGTSGPQLQVIMRTRPQKNRDLTRSQVIPAPLCPRARVHMTPAAGPHVRVYVYTCHAGPAGRYPDIDRELCPLGLVLLGAVVRVSPFRMIPLESPGVACASAESCANLLRELPCLQV